MRDSNVIYLIKTSDKQSASRIISIKVPSTLCTDVVQFEMYTYTGRKVFTIDNEKSRPRE